MSYKVGLFVGFLLLIVGGFWHLSEDRPSPSVKVIKAVEYAPIHH